MKTIDKNVSRLKRKYVTAQILMEIFRYLFLLAVGYVVVFQLAYMVSYAFRPNAEMTDPSVVWIPKTFTLENFKNAYNLLDFGASLLNTVSVQVISGLIEIISCSFVAYGLSRTRFRGIGIIFAMVMVMILLPPQMTAVPMYLNYAHFDVLGVLKFVGDIIGKELRPNLLDSGFVFWLPSVFGVGLRSGLFIFIYRQFFKGLPRELEEAASLDGASALGTFIRVVLPSSSVVILTVTIFSVVWHWNDYYLSVLFFNENYPLAVRLQQLGTSAIGLGMYIDRGLTMAACLIFILPVLIMYTILQRKFIQSIDRVGIVG